MEPCCAEAPNAYPIGQLMWVVADEAIGQKGKSRSTLATLAHLTPVGQLLPVNSRPQQLSAHSGKATLRIFHVHLISCWSWHVKYLAFRQSRRADKPTLNAGIVHAKRMKSFFRYLLTGHARFEVPLSSAQSDTDADYQRTLLEIGSVTPLPEPLVGPR